MTEDPYAASAALVGLPVPLIYDGPDNDQESPESPGLRQPDRQRAPDYIQLVRQRAQELITCIDDVESPTEQMAADFEAESVSQVKLKDMLQLSEDIHMNLERMSAMTRYHDDRRAPAIIPVPVRQSSDAVSEAGGAAMMHSKRRMNLTRRHTGGASRSCYSCDSNATPQWRIGPHGPGTLCNVCGLIYAKRHRSPVTPVTFA